MCQQKHLMETTASDFVSRISALFSKEQFISTRAKAVLEKVNQINPEGYTRTPELQVLVAFYDNLL